jgi:hypothetical protein
MRSIYLESAGSKVAHFDEVQGQTGIDYTDMVGPVFIDSSAALNSGRWQLFFDDLMKNNVESQRSQCCG